MIRTLLGFACCLMLAVPSRAEMDMSHMSGMHGTPQTCDDLTLACATTATPFVAPDGRLWIIARVGNALFVTHSDDRGRTFSASLPIQTGTVTLDWGPDARPKIVVDPKGEIVVAYTIFRDKAFNGEVFTTRSTDGGASFTPPQAITDVQESQRFVDMAFDSDGGLFAAWLDKRDRVVARAKGQPFPGAGLAFAWSHDKGTHFDKAQVAFDDTCECCRLAVAFKGPGQPVVLFRNIFPGSVRGPLRRVSVDDWEVNACPHHGPSLAIASDGTYHVAWFTQGRARRGLFYARSIDDGGHFSEPMPLGPQGQTLSRPFVLAHGRTVWLVWKAFDGARTNVMLMASHDAGATWEPARAFTQTTGASDHPILITLADRAYLSWQTGDGYRLLPAENAP
jgi:hypothetical protein